ncbi:trypsin-like peptidase domain-containing protein [Kitasatospora sp. NPDC096204]|uniref:trypsin-like peptidase domain-containing protein n=1 Tax=Kitasatospora sp. NPDC096204 TaxID=3364094 RepID=UPI003814307E
MTEIRVDRVAEVIVDGPGLDRRGSGYLVRPGTVLTAAHVIEGAPAGAGTGAPAVRVRVRFDADRPGEREFEAEVAFSHQGIDVAVLRFAGGDGVAPVSYGRVGEHDRPLDCSAVGFPRQKLRTGPDGRAFRDTKHLLATLAPLSNRREGTLELRERDTGVSLDAKRWTGISGAAVFSGGHVVGVVRAHHPDEGAGSLAVSRVDRWAEKLRADTGKPALLAELLGTPLEPDRLPDVAGPSLSRAATGLHALLRDLAPDQLTDREADLAELAAFCAGPEPYRWIQGPPWAGKTALAAWFALHPPAGVVPVCFFIASRQSGYNNAEEFTEQLVRQLAEIAGATPAQDARPGTRDQERRQFLLEAAAAVARDGGTLLLVVDGLDQDESAQGSIAALLPERPPDNIRVLVTSRPGPGLPPDLPGSHPLRDCTVTELSATDAARGIEHNARFELGRALAADAPKVDHDIVGFLAAARGLLTLADLARLAGQKQYVVRERLQGSLGRILHERGEQAGDQEVRGYLFSHDTLFSTAVERLGPELAPYRGRIDDWADGCRADGWPKSTPWYLLRSYGRMLSAEGDLRGAVALAADPRRQERLRAWGRSDGLILADLAAVREAAVQRPEPEPAALAAMAVSADLLERRNRSLPTGLPAVFARLGQPQQAEGLARSVVYQYERAAALVEVAEVLAAGTDVQRAAALVREAVRIIQASHGEMVFGKYTGPVIARAAIALAEAGFGTEAVALAETAKDVFVQFDRSADDPMDRHAAQALATVSATVTRYDPALAEQALSRAERASDQQTSFGVRIQVLAAVAAAQTDTAPRRSALTLERIEHEVADELARPEASPAELGDASVAVRELLPQTAVRLARAAYRALPPSDRSGPDWKDRDRTLAALAVNGLGEEADRLGGPGSPETAEAWARAGQPDLAYQRAGELPSSWQVARFVAAVADSRPLDEVEQWIGTTRFAGRPDVLTALAAKAVATDPARASRLAEAALTAAQTAAPDREHHDYDRMLAALADAVAACGRFADAARLARSIEAERERCWAMAATAVRAWHTGEDEHLALAERLVRQLPTEPAGRHPEDDFPIVPEALAHLGLPELALHTYRHIGRELWVVAALGRKALGREDLPGVLRRHLDGTRFRGRIAAVLDVIAALAPVFPEAYGGLLDRVRAEVLDEQRDEEAVYAPHGVAAMLLWNDNRELATQLFTGFVEVHRRLYFMADVAGTMCMLQFVAGNQAGIAQTLDRIGEPTNPAPARSAVAMLLGGVRGPLLRTPLVPNETAWLATARSCLELVSPHHEVTPERLALARRLLADALLDDGWYHALPALAELAPKAVLAARDVLFEHLGWEATDPSTTTTTTPWEGTR